MSDFKINFPFKFKKPTGKKWKLTVIVIPLVIIAFMVISSGFYTVGEQENVVITRLGKYYKSEEMSGLKFRLPLGIDKTIRLPKIEQSIEFGYRSIPGEDSTVQNIEFLMLTGDLNFIDIGFAVRYLIDDPKAFLYNLNNPKKIIDDTCISVMSQLVGDRKSLDIMDIERKNLEVLAIEEINKRLTKYQLGASIKKVEIQRTQPPKELQDAFEKVNKADQLRKQKINEGKKEYEKETKVLEGMKDRLITEANGYKEKRINNAKGDVARFEKVYAEYKKNPALTKKRIYIETMEEVLLSDKDGKNKVVIDKNLEGFLPIRNLDTEVK